MLLEFLKKAIFYICPVHKNWIVFYSFNGRGYGDSPAAIANEILKRKLPYKLFWRVNDKDKSSLPEGIIPIANFSFSTLLKVASSGIWISNVKNGFPWKKKKQQFYIQTWHGGGLPIKQVEGQVEEFLSKDYVAESKRDSAQTNMILADNNLIAELYKDYFWYPPACEIACTGLPNHDKLLEKVDVPSLKTKLFTRNDIRIALYAPTFRDDRSTEGYRIDLEAVHRKLEERTGDNWVVAVRLHPNVRDLEDKLFRFNSHIVNVTSIPDLGSLLHISDLLITDYSSVMSDFFIMRKPVFLFVLDLEHYLSNCRTIGPLFNQLPFPICINNAELIQAIESFDYSSYQAAVDAFKRNVFISYDDGHAAERVVDRIEAVVGQ